jgi:hypothetical protein
LDCFVIARSCQCLCQLRDGVLNSIKEGINLVHVIARTNARGGEGDGANVVCGEKWLIH